MDEYNEMYPPWILDDEMELSSSDSSLSGSQELVPAASLLINWVIDKSLRNYFNNCFFYLIRQN